MEQTNLGLKIKELRKSRKLTQEMLAQALGVTAQAVSKWEMNLSYPDMALLPIIANYFEVSLDTLFNFDASKKKAKINAILEGAAPLLFNNTKEYLKRIKQALIEYPDYEKLMLCLIKGYEFDYRSNGCRDGIESILDISEKLIYSCREHEIVVEAKKFRAAALLATDRYEDAKAVLMSLPDYCRDGEICLQLTGSDKLNAAINEECRHLEALYSALSSEGEAAYEIGDYIRAERCFSNIPDLIELFTFEKQEGRCHYWWDGMQTFHSFACLGLAAARRKLGKTDEAEKAEEKAYRIISTSWKDFDENKEYYMKPFEEYKKKFD